mmetsp:Transcript_1993/g.4627  ORF Transcript_1993/g.4627 Transcript_1993/m.4627 type:complete len:222 (+) Transcript_1993:3365-4030(+)
MNAYTRATNAPASASRSRMGPTTRSSSSSACASSPVAAYRATSSLSTSNASSTAACVAASASSSRVTARPMAASHAPCNMARPERQPSIATTDMDTGGSSDRRCDTCSAREACALVCCSARSRSNACRAGGSPNSSPRMRAKRRLMECVERRLRQLRSAPSQAVRSARSFSTSRTRRRRSNSAMPRRSSMDALFSASAWFAANRSSSPRDSCATATSASIV